MPDDRNKRTSRALAEFRRSHGGRQAIPTVVEDAPDEGQRLQVVDAPHPEQLHEAVYVVGRSSIAGLRSLLPHLCEEGHGAVGVSVMPAAGGYVVTIALTCLTDHETAARIVELAGKEGGGG